jgi:hypothetical protein
MALYIQSMSFGEGPEVFPRRLFDRIKMPFAFAILERMCGRKVSSESIMRPRY